MDRARRTSPGSDLTPANAALLASACVRLEGLPLAIELAAARLKVLTPGELVVRLGSRMELRAALAQNGTGPGYWKIPRGGAGRVAACIAPLLAGQ